ncbi:hypothetical protein JY651_01285 [Pyxidicoccus parkwayensis]|uniref:Peptidase M10 metallopeptidase domain-containing protein n=1 Tax=Pyxidicoccus parkwayensis TaxID=2813578 RepID=A0ABX7P2H2_9BACT|nr:hypothetical protein [Pyxidicoccus parkwaysis]QSQ23648.1 hypothetical protein JY651_01285 [Pyxidicoccus parkwaysis]
MTVLLRVLAVSALGLSLNACVYGYVKSAYTGEPLYGAGVMVSGTCTGSGCFSSTLNGEATNAEGFFVFDAYGNQHGPDKVKYITPFPGEEAISLFIGHSGHDDVMLYHRPRYESVTQDGQEYLVSNVQTVYLCGAGTPDSDFDGVCDDAESIYGTNPNSRDTDGDRISDFAELYGYGGVDLRYYGANPLKKDVFVEVDYYANRKPSQSAIDKVVAAFANAPVSNPDGTTGIALHVVLDSQIEDVDANPNLSSNWTDFDVIKAKYFPARRAPFFHYALFANTLNSGTSTGLSRGLPGHDFMVTLGAWPTPGGTELQQAGALMHQLGHNLGLQHGGNESTNYKPNYLSVMNDTYQVIGLRVDGVDGTLDYSRLRIASVNEGSLSEPNAFAPLLLSTEADLSHYGVNIQGSWRMGNASANLDFSGNGVISPGIVSLDFNGDGDTLDTVNASQNDWVALAYSGAGSIGDPHLGASLNMVAASAFLVPPDRVEQCLTAPGAKK